MWPSKTRPATFLLSILGERQPGLLPTLLGGPTAISHCARSLRGLDQSMCSIFKDWNDRTRRLQPIHGEKWKHHFEIFWDPLILFWSYFFRDFTSKIHPVQTSYPIHYCILAILARWGPPAALPHAPQAKVPLRRVHFCPTESLSKCDSMWFELQSMKWKLCANPQIPFFCCAGSESTRWTS